MTSSQGTPEPAVEQSEEVFCYRHPDTPTRLRCSRCDRPICGRCAAPASVGQHCPECLGEARRSAPKVRSVATATSPAVVGIIVANVIVYFIQLMAGDDFTNRFGMVPSQIQDGEWWRLFTSMFLHSPTSIFHIVFNMMVLYVYGSNVEGAFGTTRFIALYVMAGFLGSATSFAFGPQLVIGVGASGAIFGIVGVLLVYLYRRRTSTFLGQYLRGLLFFIGLNLLLGFAIANIDVLAHIGGLLAGVALGVGFDRGAATKAESPGGVQLATALAVVGVGVLFVVVGL
jgi:membrane associated rhomboid family serine protease